jgi:hypothetical protein
MRTYIAPLDELIFTTTRKMTKLANETHEPVYTVFNEIEITCNPGADSDSLVEYFTLESLRRQDEKRMFKNQEPRFQIRGH